MNTYSFMNVKYADYEPSKIVSIQLLTIGPDGYESISSLVKPYPGKIYDTEYLHILGISEEEIKSAPTLRKLWWDIKPILSKSTAIFYHTASNYIALKDACAEYDLTLPKRKYINSERIVRRTWNEFRSSGYGLLPLASHFKLDPSLNYAEITKAIVDLAAAEQGMDYEGLIKLAESSIKYYHPYDPDRRSKLAEGAGDPEGPFYGDTIVFTGKLDRPRTELRELALSLGFNFADSVKKDTTMLVVGTYDNPTVMSIGKSSKQIKAERTNAEGKTDIQIMSSDTFYKMIKEFIVDQDI